MRCLFSKANADACGMWDVGMCGRAEELPRNLASRRVACARRTSAVANLYMTGEIKGETKGETKPFLSDPRMGLRWASADQKHEIISAARVHADYPNGGAVAV